jgi:hypothetical protein
MVKVVQAADASGTGYAPPLSISSPKSQNNKETDPAANETTEKNEEQHPAVASILSKILDVTVTFVMGVAVVSAWRGLWLILDFWTCADAITDGIGFCAFDPAQHEKSGEVTLLVGVCLFVVAIHWRSYIQALIEAEGVVEKCSKERLHTYALFFGTVSLWHGLWYLADSYVLPESGDPSHPAMNPTSYWISHAFGTVGLVGMSAFSSTLAAPLLVFVDSDCEVATDYPYM